MLITKFYEGQDVFITGGSGFLGKALIEKLLRSCPKIGKVILLLRAKKGKNIEERLQELANESFFDPLRQSQPQQLQKLHAIEGDCSELGLGIKPEDLEKLKNVSIIFHAAACIRFDAPLREAILLNTRGTLEMVKLALTMKQLKALVHVSTAYTNPQYNPIQEKIYPALADWRTSIKLAETYDIETLNIYNNKYASFQPNTYTFTKHLAEHIINDYRNQLPVIVFRPSIVISALAEPLPGWLDNFNGPIGMLAAGGLGLNRVVLGDGNTHLDCIPVDIVIRAMLLTAYKKGLEPNYCNESEVDVINCCSYSFYKIKLKEFDHIGVTLCKKHPYARAMWIPQVEFTTCAYWFMMKFLVLHIMISLCLDTLMILGSKKPFLFRLQRRLFETNYCLKVFMSRSWKFDIENFKDLDRLVPKSETDQFGAAGLMNFDLWDYLSKGLRGTQIYLLKQEDKHSAAAHKRYKVLQTLSFLSSLLSMALIARFTIRFLYRQYMLV